MGRDVVVPVDVRWSVPGIAVSLADVDARGSGTLSTPATGLPPTACRPSRSWSRAPRRATDSFRPGRVLLHAAPMFHLTVFSSRVRRGVVGGTQVMIPAVDPVAALTTVRKHGVNDVLLVVDLPRVDEFDLSSTRRVIGRPSVVGVEVARRPRLVSLHAALR